MANANLAQLREEMKKRDIDIYVIPTADFHESEYVGEYFKERMFITGFTGSAGTAVVTQKEAGLWTDGRYYIQAEHQIAGKDVKLFKMGEKGVPTVTEYVEQVLENGGSIGFDGRTMNTALGEQFLAISERKQGRLHTGEDLVGIVWKDRPELPAEKIFVLEDKYAGESTQSKLKRVREAMKEAGASVHILTSLYDIAWLYNIRGNDIPCVPVVLSFTVITENEACLFLNEDVLTAETRAYLENNHVTIRPYSDIYQAVAELKSRETVLLSKDVTNYNITSALHKGIKVIDRQNPTMRMKASKNETEIENTINAHVKDGVAVTKFMYWLKKNIGKIPMTELTAQDYLLELRKQQGIIEPSFETICAYQANGAMMHYKATEESHAELKPEGFLLVDSGGQYLEGTTDITRTFVLGEITAEQRLYFTTVVRSMLRLANAKFLEGCSGQNLDILARGPMWDLGLDYKCGTGHGVGHLLNVHEPPIGFRWNIVPERLDSAPFVEGNIVTDEPGIYLEGRYGIRVENELVCRRGEKNEYGQFMYFDTITYAPIDLDAVDPEALSFREKQWLNDYHKTVFETLSPYMTEEENIWLKEYTRAI